MKLTRIGTAALLAVAPLLALHAQAIPEDKYAWLEDVSSERSMAWVNDHNARTAKVLEADPRYAANFADALKIAEDPTRLAIPDLRGGEIYNNWRDAANPRGLLRRATIASYLSTNPIWTPVLDFDALGKAEKTGWVGHGMSCLYPGDKYCLVNLSAGGEDSVTLREFDLQSAKFIDSGFTSLHSKQSVSWLDKDTLLIARDWGAGTMTKSSYPFVVKEWRRGTPPDNAREIFRGEATDEVGSRAGVLHDAQGDQLEIIGRGVTFFESQTFVKTPRGIERLNIPSKSSLSGMIAGRLLLTIETDWTANGKTFPQGSLLELKLSDIAKDPANLKPSIVFAPTTDEFLGSVATTRDRLLITTLAHVQGRAYVYTPGKAWTHQRLPVPENASVSIVSASDTDNHFFLNITGFLTPPSLWYGNATTATIAQSKTQPALFDASRDAVEQYEATSKDGTKIPYFIVHPKSMKLDGTNPTVLTAYGGFQLSETPNYSAATGKLWLEHGGVWVLANIRGGGEFGPAWHEAGLKTHRQRIYDDFAAVAQNLIDRKITSPPHLGIIGGSNGGLLMGVEFEQHPDLWNAVVIQVPLLDMLGYEHIAAGASWVGEYGSTKVPEERAFLATISPYNNLKPDGKYPEPLIFTTTKDDRVGPQHARKFAAKMEEYKLPFFYAEITEGGHGSGADIKQQAGTTALTYTYLARKLMQP